MKMYVVVRTDIPKNWYIPQACHAVAQFAFDDYHFGEFKDMFNWGNGNIVVLGAADKDHLKWIASNAGVDCSKFYESYKDSDLTAISFISDRQVEAVDNLPLL